MRSHVDLTTRDPTSTPAFSAAFLVQFLGHEAEIEVLRQAGAVLGRSVLRVETPTPENFSRSLAALVGSELEVLATFLDQAASKSPEGHWAALHRTAAFRMARVSELVPQLHALAVLFAELEVPARLSLESWQPGSPEMGEDAALGEVRRRLLSLVRTLRFSISNLRRLEERLPSPQSGANGDGQEATPRPTVAALSEALDVVIVDRLAPAIATLETAGEIDGPEWHEDPKRRERVLAESDPSWPAKAAGFGAPASRTEDPVASLRSGARALVRQLEDSAAYLRSKLSAVPVEHPEQAVLTAHVDAAVGALGDAVGALEELKE